MAREIVITAGAVSARATLLDNPTADAIWDALPLDAAASTWGGWDLLLDPGACRRAGWPGSGRPGRSGLLTPGSAFCISSGPRR